MEDTVGLADLKRVTDLFVEGEIVVFDESDSPLTLWVNKLNSFEREEAQRDGQAARSRTILAMKNDDSSEYVTFEANLSQMDDDHVREAMANTQGNEFFLDAVDSIRQDPEWAELVEAGTRVTDDMDDDEVAAVLKLTEDYNTELGRRIEFRRAGYIQQLVADMAPAKLREEYRKAWLDAQGFGRFQREYTKTMLFFAVRVCKAVRDGDDWKHDACEGHRKRALDDRSEVVQLPDALLTKLEGAAQRVQINGRDARFSGALASSSGSSAQPKPVEESAASTPEETSSGPVSISSSPLVKH